MFVTPAYAQTAGGGGDLFMSILPFVLMFVIFYFLLIRPQRKQMQERKEMLSNVRRNDTVVTGGGVVGKVTKVIDDNEVEVEIAKDVKVRVMRSLIADVRVKGEPAKQAAKQSAK
ncbi:preprotein translocase subunit YajC [Salaquimonas pukyongi]|uniref:preprotein translocase subunit YajC n=1 Tax=Salaquimonas pukyongi TaxID=2712698 RepID=UPI00096B7427|nr:preprotein translocase subunit YajC [Salaquimonas pukyongi]